MKKEHGGNKGAALYMQIQNSIQEAIHNGVYKEGDKLLSEKEFCEQYGVSRITVRQALKHLESQGIIYSVHGKGYFVQKTTISDDLHKISTFGETLRRRGYSGFTRIAKYAETAEQHAYDLLLDDPEYGAPCEMALVGYSESVPVVMYQSVIRKSIGVRMLEQAKQLEDSNIAFSTFDLYDRIGIAVGKVMQKISARNADAELSRLLDIKEGDAVLVLESMVYDESGGLMEFKRGCYRADKYSFNIRREVR